MRFCVVNDWGSIPFFSIVFAFERVKGLYLLNLFFEFVCFIWNSYLICDVRVHGWKYIVFYSCF